MKKIDIKFQTIILLVVLDLLLGKIKCLATVQQKILENVITSGARFVWLDVFNSNLSEDAYPVVSNGYKEGKLAVDP